MLSLLSRSVVLIIKIYEHWRRLRPVWIEGEGGGMVESRVELTKNRLILGQFHSTLLYSTLFNSFNLNGPVWIEGEGGGGKGSRIELAKNRLILDQIYFTLLSLPQSQYK